MYKELKEPQVMRLNKNTLPKLQFDFELDEIHSALEKVEFNIKELDKQIKEVEKKSKELQKSIDSFNSLDVKATVSLKHK